MHENTLVSHVACYLAAFPSTHACMKTLSFHMLLAILPPFPPRMPFTTRYSPFADVSLVIATRHLPLAISYLPLATFHFPLSTCHLPPFHSTLPLSTFYSKEKIKRCFMRTGMYHSPTRRLSIPNALLVLRGPVVGLSAGRTVSNRPMTGGACFAG
jgi:hypothetical protein